MRKHLLKRDGYKDNPCIREFVFRQRSHFTDAGVQLAIATADPNHEV